jgi:hypothetical protein
VPGGSGRLVLVLIRVVPLLSLIAVVLVLTLLGVVPALIRIVLVLSLIVVVLVLSLIVVVLVLSLIVVVLVLALIGVVLVLTLLFVVLGLALTFPLIGVTTWIRGLTAVGSPSVAELALAPGGALRGCAGRRGRCDDRKLLRPLHGRGGDGHALSTIVRARSAERHQKARGNGQGDGARHGDELPRVAKCARKMRPDEIRVRGQQR